MILYASRRPHVQARWQRRHTSSHDDPPSETISTMLRIAASASCRCANELVTPSRVRCRAFAAEVRPVEAGTPPSGGQRTGASGGVVTRAVRNREAATSLAAGRSGWRIQAPVRL